MVGASLPEFAADPGQIGAALPLPADTVAAAAFRAGLGVENLTPAFGIARAPHQFPDRRNALLAAAHERRQQRLRALLNLRIAAGVYERSGKVLELRRQSLLLLQIEQQVKSGLETRQHTHGGAAHFIRLLTQDELPALGVESRRSDFAGCANGRGAHRDWSRTKKSFEFSHIRTVM